ncbi:hypothetical protein QCA50_020657 [Cerrena zonata]|uniref:Uncharacterized protein n=1 Tax=Cerrena zonata TaxID=2478898 RepID=A0AAW0FBB1_9APHY
MEEIMVILVYVGVSVFSAGRIYAIWGANWRPASIVLSVALLVPVTNMYHYALSKPAAWPAPFVGCAETFSLSDAQFAR